MADEQLILSTKVEVDEPSIQRAAKSFERLEKAVERAAQKIKAADAKTVESLKLQEKEFDELRKSVDSATEAKERFYKENSKARLGSLSPFANEDGGQPLSRRQRGNQLREVGTTIRNLPSIQVPGQAFGTDTLARGVELAGRFGLTVAEFAGIAATATVAVGALAVAIHFLQKAAEENTKVINAGSDAASRFNQFVAGGGTSKQAEVKIDDLENARVAAQRTVDQLEAAQQAFIDSRTVPFLNEIADKFNITIFGIDGGVNAFDAEIAKAEETLKTATFEESLYTGALDDGTFAKADAAEAEKKLSEERTKSALAAASLAATLATTLAEASEFGLGALESAQRQLDVLMGNDVAGAGEQAVESRLRSIENQKKAVQAQIEALRQSGVTTEAVTEQLANLEAQLSTLGAQSDIVSESLGAAKARDRETESILGQIDALKEAEQAREQAAREAEQRAKQIKDAATRRDDSLKDAQQKYYDSLRDAQADFIQDELKAVREANRDIRDIDTEAQRGRRDALAEGRFLELSNIEQERQDSLQDLATQLADERQEREIAYRLQQGDIRTALNRQNRDIATAYERNMRNIVGIVNTGARGVEQAFGAMMSSLKRSASGGSMVAGTSAGANSPVQGTQLAGLRFVRSS